MSIHTSQLFSQVLDQALRSSTREDDAPAGGGTEALLAKLIGGYLGPMLGQTADAADGNALQPLLQYAGAALTHYAELKTRDATLAAALGACDCWGEDEACEHCHGDGFPGWSLPDEPLFTEYVRPALTTLARNRRRGRANAPRLATVIATDDHRGE